MTTAYQTGPGFYAANTKECDPTVPEGCVRIYCVRLEAYDLERKPDEEGLDVSFEIIFAKAEKDRRLATALLALGRAIEGNRAKLERMERGQG